METAEHAGGEIRLDAIRPPASGFALRRGAALKVPEPDTVIQAFARHILPVRQFGRVFATSPVMHEVFDVLGRIAATNVSVTLVGETGCGKDVLAHALHERSARADAPFVIFDCGAVAANLAESELFGHERGAFTGAVSTHAGAFERAHGGTLFLDEIGELPLDLQPRLLRVLESGKVRRVGGMKDRSLDVRIVSATHRNLRADVAAGTFRQDLFFRLGAAVVTVPPLRDRLDDLPFLVKSLLRDLGRNDLGVSEEVIEELCSHSWPGNVRELKNVISCALAFLDDTASVLAPSHLRMPPRNPVDSAVDRLPLAGLKLEAIECAAIKQTLSIMGGNKVRAAQSLGIAVSTLYEKLRKYALSSRESRSTLRPSE